jgi:hypothetical protein
LFSFASNRIAAYIQRMRKKEFVENSAGTVQPFVKTGEGEHSYTDRQSASGPRAALRSSVRLCAAPPVHSTRVGDTEVNLTVSASGSPST